MDINAIATALMQHVGDLEIGSPALPIAYPDVAFTPPADGKYLAVQFLANAPAWEGLSEGRRDQGLLQVTVVWPKGLGVIRALDAAQDVIAHFPKGLVLSGVKITGQPYAGSPLLDDADTRVPVTIPWAA